MTEEELNTVKRIHEAFRIRRENYGKIRQVLEKLTNVIPNSQWKDDQAKYGIATLFSGLTLLNGRIESLEELDERMMIYLANTEDFMRKLMPILTNIAEKLDTVTGEHDKLTETKKEVESIANGIRQDIKRYDDALEFLEDVNRHLEEDRKKLEKGLSYVG